MEESFLNGAKKRSALPQNTRSKQSLSQGMTPDKLEDEFRKTGDLGLVAEKHIAKKKQATLFSHKLTVTKVFANLQKLATVSGEGSVEQKVQLLAELLTSASPPEAKYIIRTALEQMRVGIGQGTLRDAIAWCVFPRFVQLFDDIKQIDEKKCKQIETIKVIDNYDKKDCILFSSELLAREAYNKLIAALDHA